jgi:Nucleotide-diphospho-sugar transferase
MKPITVQAILKKGYAVHASDIDISYLPKDLWKSYMKYIAEVDAIAAFQRDTKHPYIVNTGNYVILPTAAGRKFMATWVATADAAIDAGNHEQHALGELYHQTRQFEYCNKPAECREAVATHAHRKHFPIIRRTHNPWGNVYGENCVTKELGRIYPAHPCSYPHLYFHVLCLSGGATAKTEALKKAGLWFMDDFGEDACPPDAENPHTVRCKPLAWRLPTTEESFQECSYKDRLAFRYFQVHDGVAFTNWDKI